LFSSYHNPFLALFSYDAPWSFQQPLIGFADTIIEVGESIREFPSEPLIIALILSQQKKMINWLIEKVSQNKK